MTLLADASIDEAANSFEHDDMLVHNSRPEDVERSYKAGVHYARSFYEEKLKAAVDALEEMDDYSYSAHQMYLLARDALEKIRGKCV